MNSALRDLAFPCGTVGRPMRVINACSNSVLHSNISLGTAGPSFLAGYVKLLPESARAIESVAAWIAREMKLPVPDPLFARISRTSVPKEVEWPYSVDSVIAFVSSEIPNARSLARTADLTLLRGWPALLEVAIFDLLIANEDRSEANILVSGRARFHIIDHERAMGGAGRALFSRNYFPAVGNPLLDLLAGSSLASRYGMRRSILESAARLELITERVPYSDLLVTPTLSEEISAFLQARSTRLVEMVFDRLNIRELTGLPSSYSDIRPAS